MTNHAQPTPPSAAAPTHGAATHALELLEARQLRDALRLLLRREQAGMAEFLVALADFDRRRGWEALGHSSLFAFLHVELGLSKGAAFVRSSAARLIQSFPDVLVPLRDGRLCLSSVAELARVATPDNLAAVLPRFFGCSSREAREVAAAILPREAPPQREQVTRVDPAARISMGGPSRSVVESSCSELSLVPSPADVAAALSLSPEVDFESVRAHELALTHPARVAAPRDDIEPLTANLRRLHITVSREFLRDLEAARGGLSHAIPNATTGQVLQEALRLLLEKQAKARGLVKRPRATLAAAAPRAVAAGEPMVEPQQASPPLALIPTEPPTAEPLHRRTGPRAPIPAAVRRAVWERDAGRCAWPLDSGGVCGSTYRLELDHIIPWACWGQSTAENLRVVCGLCRSRHKPHYAASDLMPRASVESLSAWHFGKREAA